jgi:cytosine/adenosine deaminase-related metal-dependent hydrolase
MSDCGGTTPVQHLQRFGLLGENVLAAHVNRLGSGDARRLAAAGTSVVHCPRSHRFFRHAPFPWRELETAGVRVCLGTDSLASIDLDSGRLPELDLRPELRAVCHAHPDRPLEAILALATVNAARALGMAGQLGQLSEGAWADWIAVPFSGPIGSALEAVLNHRGPVTMSMIGGEWIVPSAP